MTTAVLLVAHGSRRSEANDDLKELARMLSVRLPEEIIEIAYLELASPTIPEGLDRCLSRGATEIDILPYFLSAGAHVTEDLEEFRQQMTVANPYILCRVAPPLGLHAKMMDILVDRLAQGRGEL